MAAKVDDLYCKFCGRNGSEVLVLIAGPGGIHICDLCVDICAPLVQKHRTAAPEDLLHDAEVVREELQRMARGKRE
jgi:ATP-dependent Clp protease ATP-binding subunit ClpX